MATTDPTARSVQPTVDLDDGRMVFRREASATPEAAAVSPAPPPQRDTSMTKVNASYSPRGKHGQKYLATEVKLSLCLWEDEQPGKRKSLTQRAYATAGYVMSGRAELELEGQTVVLEPGDAWIVPKGAIHRYTIVEPCTAVEATCSPAEVHGRDDECKVGLSPPVLTEDLFFVSSSAIPSPRRGGGTHQGRTFCCCLRRVVRVEGHHSCQLCSFTAERHRPMAKEGFCSL
jgi:mannose-6-phosphate isomerase-like protein (cupin superfamily)